VEEYSEYVGLDVHKDTIAVAVASAGRSKPRSLGIIRNTKKSVLNLLSKLSPDGEVLGLCYEAGPCGYELYRWVEQTGHDCVVVAPSKIPKKSGERVKTDRRDAVKLSSLFRSGELTPVWVPDTEQEAMRDLSRAREEMKRVELQLKQRLGAFLLRHSKRYTAGKCKWTQRFYRWLSDVKMELPLQQIVLEEYVDAVKQAESRVRDLDKELVRAVESWNLKPVVESLMALRGVNFLTAMSIVAELGDISRFETPRQLMGYLGLVPSEHSSGGKAKRGGITKTGNGRVRRLLVETAWCYRFPARRSYHMEKKSEKATKEAQAIGWKAQKRLCHRYREFLRAGKHQGKVTAAIARELSGFVWAIACAVTEVPTKESA
jgi:transposase